MIHDGRPFFRGLHDSFFEFLPFLPAGRMLDVGAAIGHYTKVMRRLSPRSPVTAFEPFAGNVPHFWKTVGDDPQVTLVNKAVMDCDGPVSFHVPDIKSQGRWSDKLGFSSVGSVIAPTDPRDAIRIEACSIDSTIREHVVAMKIDVQGAELAVLTGAKRLIEREGIDFLYVEFSGELDILRFLIDSGYRIYNSYYVIFRREGLVRPDDWEIDSERELSTGRKTLFGWPKNQPRDPERLCEFFVREQRRIGALITDLVCVHQRALPLFEGAALMTNRVADFEPISVS